MSFAIVAAGVAVGTAGYQIYSGAHAKSKAKKEQARLNASRPKLPVSPYAQQQYDLARSELSNGMSSQAEQAYNNASDRQFSTSLDAILKGGGDINNIGELFDASDQGRQRLALAKENMRINNINNLVRASQNLTNEEQNAFKFNQWAPWADKAQANAQSMIQGQQTMDSGISSLGNIVASYLGGLNSFGNAGSLTSRGQGGNAGPYSTHEAGTGYLMNANANNIQLIPTNYSTNFSPAAAYGSNLPAAGSLRINGQ